MFFGKRPKRRNDSQTMMVKWIIIGLVAAAFLSHVNKPADAPDPVANSLHRAASDISAQTSGIVSNYKNAVAPAAPPPTLSIAEISSGDGAPVQYGKPANIHVTIRTLDGKKIYSSHDGDGEPLSVTPGKTPLFAALEQGIIGMKEGGKRTLTVPPEFQQTVGSAAPATDFHLPLHQTVLVEVEAIP